MSTSPSNPSLGGSDQTSTRRAALVAHYEKLAHFERDSIRLQINELHQNLMTLADLVDRDETTSQLDAIDAITNLLSTAELDDAVIALRYAIHDRDFYARSTDTKLINDEYLHTLG